MRLFVLALSIYEKFLCKYRKFITARMKWDARNKYAILNKYIQQLKAFSVHNILNANENDEPKPKRTLVWFYAWAVQLFKTSENMSAWLRFIECVDKMPGISCVRAEPVIRDVNISYSKFRHKFV